VGLEGKERKDQAGGGGEAQARRAGKGRPRAGEGRKWEGPRGSEGGRRGARGRLKEQSPRVQVRIRPHWIPPQFTSLLRKNFPGDSALCCA